MPLSRAESLAVLKQGIRCNTTDGLASELRGGYGGDFRNVLMESSSLGGALAESLIGFKARSITSSVFCSIPIRGALSSNRSNV